jgi:hypothetical protein
MAHSPTYSLSQQGAPYQNARRAGSSWLERVLLWPAGLPNPGAPLTREAPGVWGSRDTDSRSPHVKTVSRPAPPAAGGRVEQVLIDRESLST